MMLGQIGAAAGACCGCSTPGLCATYTIRFCTTVVAGSGYAVGAGVLVRILTAAGGSLVAEGLTNAAGQVTLCVPSAATRWVEVSGVPHFAGARGQSVVTNAIDKTVAFGSGAFPPDVGWCCNTFANACTDAPPSLRPPLFLTDANGTYPQDSPCLNVWTVPAPVAQVGGFLAGTGCVASGPGMTRVQYTLAPAGAGWRLGVTWSGASVIGPPAYLAYPPVAGCTSTGNDASGNTGPTDCLDFYLVFNSFTQNTGSLPMPVSGSVVISA